MYDIGGDYYSLADICHGILLAPFDLPDLPFSSLATLVLPLSKLEPTDPRYACRIDVPEPFLHFCLAPGTVSGGRLSVFRPESLRSQIRAEAANYIRVHASVVVVSRRIILPAVLKWHHGDFGGSWHEVLARLVQRLPETELAQGVAALTGGPTATPLASAKLSIKYTPYKWSFGYRFTNAIYENHWREDGTPSPQGL